MMFRKPRKRLSRRGPFKNRKPVLATIVDAELLNQLHGELVSLISRPGSKSKKRRKDQVEPSPPGVEQSSQEPGPQEPAR